MAGDSAGVSGWDLDVRADPKVFITGPFIMGFTTSFRMGQLLEFSLDVPEQGSKESDYKFMVTTFIDACRECFKEGGFTASKSSPEQGGEFLVGYRGKLYYIAGDFQVGIVKSKFDAVGCGSSYAKGCLHGTESLDLTPRQRLTAALKAAERFSAGVRGPYTYREK